MILVQNVEKLILLHYFTWM